jgi:hypothetical protein
MPPGRVFETRPGFSKTALLRSFAVKNRATVLVIALMALVLAGCAPSLPRVVGDAYTYLRGQIPQGSKVAFLNIESSSPALSREILDGLIEQAVNDRDHPFAVIDTVNLDMIRAEMGIEISGEAGGEIVQWVGLLLGAQTVISGEVTPAGNRWRLTIRALETETANIQGQFVREIKAVAGY